MKSLSNFSLGNVLQGTLTVDDIAGDTVTLNGVEFVEGQFGEVAIMDVTLSNGTTVKVRTGGKVLLDILHKAEEAGDYPYTAKFVKNKRYWTVE